MLTSTTFEDVANIAAVVQNLDLQIERVLTNTLLIIGRQPRAQNRAKIEALAKIFDACDFIPPIVIDESGRVLAGIVLLQAAKLLGRKHVPTVKVTDLSDAAAALLMSE